MPAQDRRSSTGNSAKFIETSNREESREEWQLQCCRCNHTSSNWASGRHNESATLITSHSARLNGTVDPHGLSTTVYFQYGRTISYGSRTPNQTKTGNNYQNVIANISGLSADTTYHFRIVATNTAGTRYGSDRTFITQ